MSDRLTPEQLRELADDAFDVLNWAKRLGMKKQAQIDEMVRTFEVRLGYRKPDPSLLADGGANIHTKHENIQHGVRR